VPFSHRSNCHGEADCYPTEIEYRNREIYARRREVGRLIRVPENKIERRRDSTDGRNRLCAPPPERVQNYDGGVICFIAGSGS
jgi:hypothetical protein